MLCKLEIRYMKRGRIKLALLIGFSLALTVFVVFAVYKTPNKDRAILNAHSTSNTLCGCGIGYQGKHFR